MQFTSLSTALVLAASTLAAGQLYITKPEKDAVIPVGSTTEIAWQSGGAPSSNKVTVILAGGPSPDKLEECGVLADSINNIGTMSWTVTGTKPIDSTSWACSAWGDDKAIFGIKIQDSLATSTNWSPQFSIKF